MSATTSRLLGPRTIASGSCTVRLISAICLAMDVLTLIVDSHY
jgi:hypothetical protein